MTLFPESFIVVLIWASLIWTALGGLLLIGLLIKDFKNKSIW